MGMGSLLSLFISPCWHLLKYTPHSVWFLCLWLRWLFLCLSSWLQSLSRYTLSPYLHAFLPFLDCRKLGGVSKSLPQVHITRRHVESIFLLPSHTEAQGMLWSYTCPTCKAQIFLLCPRRSGGGGLWYLENSLGSLWECITGFLYSWFPYSRWDELGKDPELFLRNPLMSKPSSFLLIFSLHLPVQVNFI